MTRSRRFTSVRAAVGVVAAVLAIVPAAVASPASVDAKVAVTAAAPGVYVDDVLVRQLADGRAPALIGWDKTRTTRHDIQAYLDRAGVDAFTFDKISVSVACAATAQDVSTISRAPGVVSIYGNRRLIPAVDESVPTAYNGSPAPTWSQGLTGKGVGIAIIDTGVDASHPDIAFGTRVKENVRVLVSHREYLGEGDPPPCQDFYSESMEDTEITSGHGTHMASVAAGDGTASDGRFKGMAPEADLLGVQVLDTFSFRTKDTGPYVREYTQNEPSLLGGLAGINYTLQRGIENGPLLVKVALMGWVIPGLHHPWDLLVLASKDMRDFGITVVLPAGNNGPAQSDCSAAETCYFNAAAAGDHAIAVGATPKTMAGRTTLASYSSRGDPVEYKHGIDPWAEYFRYEPTIVAPGTNVVAARRAGFAPTPVGGPWRYIGAGPSGSVDTDPEYVSLTGTSVAAAHVAGAIAVMQQASVEKKGCFLTTSQVRDALRQSATPIPGAARWEAGAGALDATKAVQVARDMPKSYSRELWMCPNQELARRDTTTTP